MRCGYCELAERGDSIYKDDNLVIVHDKKAAAIGHLRFISRKHYTILEEVPDDIIKYMGIIVNKVSMVLFQMLGLHGTNMIIENGEPAGQKHFHFSINLIPRKEGDGLNFRWEPKPYPKDIMDSLERQIYEEAYKLKESDIGSSGSVSESVGQKEIPKESFLLKHLRRIP